MKTILIAILTILYCGILQAQLPTNAEIKKKVGGETPGVKSFKFTGRAPFERYNKTNQVTEWCKELIMVRAADDIKTMDMEYKGLAVYEKRAGTYSFYKFIPYQRKYVGQPQITFEEVQAIIAKDWASFYGHYYNKIVKLEKAPNWVNEPYIRWHNITSVEVFLKATFEYISSNIETERKVQVFSVRLYRDDLGKPWKRFYAQTFDYDENELLEIKTYTPQQINKMSQKTLGFILLQQGAMKAIAIEPAIEVPTFNSLMDITVYLHYIIRNGKTEQLKAALLQMPAPEHFVAGSKFQLNEKGEALVNEANDKAYKWEGTYKRVFLKKIRQL
jgi:hypothetical protein